MRKPVWQYIGVIAVFLVNTLGSYPVQAENFRLPAPGVLVHLSAPLDPPILKGMKVHPDNPFRFDFILDRGDNVIPVPDKSIRGQAPAGTQDQKNLKAEATKLIKYFLASLTIPESDLWVNLSPYEKNRIIPTSFGLTEMGRDLLAEDYILKQITASLIYPEDETGKKFWKRIYAQAAEKFGTTNIPVNTFNKVWIIPDKAVVYENAKAGTAYVVDAKLKVMLETDYLSMSKHQSQPGDMSPKGTCPQAGCQAEKPLNMEAPRGNPRQPNDNISALGSQILREIVIPELTKEVNEGKNFAQLRQVYNSLILATWYKKKIKDSILAQIYEDQKKVAGIQYNSSVIARSPKGDEAISRTTNDVEVIYHRYLQAFKKGAYNYIKEEIDPVTQQAIPRKYFSGGITALGLNDSAMKIIDHGDVAMNLAKPYLVTADFSPSRPNAAMAAIENSKYRIMLIEHTPEVADIYEAVLLSHGYQVEKYTLWGIGLTKFYANPENYSLVLTDFNSEPGNPHMNGVVLAHMIRQSPKGPNIHIVINTLTPNDAIKEREKYGLSNVEIMPFKLVESDKRGRHDLTNLIEKIKTQGLLRPAADLAMQGEVDIPHIIHRLRYNPRQHRLFLENRELGPLGQGEEDEIFFYPPYAVRISKVRGIDRGGYVRKFNRLADLEIAPRVLEDGFLDNQYYALVLENIMNAVSVDEMAILTIEDQDLLINLFKRMLFAGIYVEDFRASKFMIGPNAKARLKVGVKQAWLINAKDYQEGWPVQDLAVHYYLAIISNDKGWEKFNTSRIREYLEEVIRNGLDFSESETLKTAEEIDRDIGFLDNINERFIRRLLEIRNRKNLQLGAVLRRGERMSLAEANAVMLKAIPEIRRIMRETNGMPERSVQLAFLRDAQTFYTAKALAEQKAVVLENARILQRGYSRTEIRPVYDREGEEIIKEILHQIFEKTPPGIDPKVARELNAKHLEVLAGIFYPFFKDHVRRLGKTFPEYKEFLLSDKGAVERESIIHMLASSLEELRSGVRRTRFFRDVENWGLSRFLSVLIREKWAKKDLTITSRHLSGSDGREVYSVGMMIYYSFERFYEELQRQGLRLKSFKDWLNDWSVHIDSYDINIFNLLKTKQGIYSIDQNDFTDINRQMESQLPGFDMTKFVEPFESDYKILEPIRRWVHPVFIDLDKHTEWPILSNRPYRYDLNFSLNTMMYLDSENAFPLLKMMYDSRTVNGHSLMVYTRGIVPPVPVQFNPEGTYTLTSYAQVELNRNPQGYSTLLNLLKPLNPDERGQTGNAAMTSSPWLPQLMVERKISKNENGLHSPVDLAMAEEDIPRDLFSRLQYNFQGDWLNFDNRRLRKLGEGRNNRVYFLPPISAAVRVRIASGGDVEEMNDYANRFNHLANLDLTPRILAHGFIDGDPQGHYALVAEAIIGQSLDKMAQLTSVDQDLIIQLIRDLLINHVWLPDFKISQFMIGVNSHAGRYYNVPKVWLVDAERAQHSRDSVKQLADYYAKVIQYSDFGWKKFDTTRILQYLKMVSDAETVYFDSKQIMERADEIERYIQSLHTIDTPFVQEILQIPLEVRNGQILVLSRPLEEIMDALMEKLHALSRNYGNILQADQKSLIADVKEFYTAYFSFLREQDFKDQTPKRSRMVALREKFSRLLKRKNAGDQAMLQLTPEQRDAIVRHMLDQETNKGIFKLQALADFGSSLGFRNPADFWQVIRELTAERAFKPDPVNQPDKYTSFLETYKDDGTPTGNAEDYWAIREKGESGDWYKTAETFLFDGEGNLYLQVRPDGTLDSSGGTVEVGASEAEAARQEAEEEMRLEVQPLDLVPINNALRRDGRYYAVFGDHPVDHFDEKGVYYGQAYQHRGREMFHPFKVMLTSKQKKEWLKQVRPKIISWKRYRDYREGKLTLEPLNEEVLAIVKIGPQELLNYYRSQPNSKERSKILAQGLNSLLAHKSIQDFFKQAEIARQLIQDIQPPSKNQVRLDQIQRLAEYIVERHGSNADQWMEAAQTKVNELEKQMPRQRAWVFLIFRGLEGVEQANGRHTKKPTNPAQISGVPKERGGIDLTAAQMSLEIQNRGRGIQFHLDPAQLAQLQNAPGLTPVIINIQPLRDVKSFLGIVNQA